MKPIRLTFIVALQVHNTTFLIKPSMRLHSLVIKDWLKCTVKHSELDKLNESGFGSCVVWRFLHRPSFSAQPALSRKVTDYTDSAKTQFHAARESAQELLLWSLNDAVQKGQCILIPYHGWTGRLRSPTSLYQTNSGRSTVSYLPGGCTRVSAWRAACARSCPKSCDRTLWAQPWWRCW